MFHLENLETKAKAIQTERDVVNFEEKNITFIMMMIKYFGIESKYSDSDFSEYFNSK